MPIKHMLTEAEKAAVYAARVFVFGLLGADRDIKLTLISVCLVSRSAMVIEVKLGGAKDYLINVRLQKRTDKNTERDERWYPIAAWDAADATKPAGRFRFDGVQESVQFFDNPPVITGIWTIQPTIAQSGRINLEESMVAELGIWRIWHLKPRANIDERFLSKSLQP